MGLFDRRRPALEEWEQPGVARGEGYGRRGCCVCVKGRPAEGCQQKVQGGTMLEVRLRAQEDPGLWEVR